MSSLTLLTALRQVFYISGAFGLTMRGILIDMKDGYEMVPGSDDLEYGHNTDGFDVSGSTLVYVSHALHVQLAHLCLFHCSTMTNNVVFNQDDAVAVTSGGDIVWDNSYCYGGHGASVGSVGLKSNNTVDGVIFSNTKIIASQNGARIKTNSGASGVVNNVTYSNIDVQDISIYGVSQC